MCQRIYNFHLEASRNWMYLKTRLHTLLRFTRWTLSSTRLSVEGGRPQDPWDLVYLKLKPFTRNKNSECNMTLWRPGLPLNSPPYSSGGILCSLFFLSFFLAFSFYLAPVLAPASPRYWPSFFFLEFSFCLAPVLATDWPRCWPSYFFLEFSFYLAPVLVFFLLSWILLLSGPGMTPVLAFFFLSWI